MLMPVLFCPLARSELSIFLLKTTKCSWYRTQVVHLQNCKPLSLTLALLQGRVTGLVSKIHGFFQDFSQPISSFFLCLNFDIKDTMKLKKKKKKKPQRKIFFKFSVMLIIILWQDSKQHSRDNLEGSGKSNEVLPFRNLYWKFCFQMALAMLLCRLRTSY